jgi:ABC-2 type transport system permease protein
MKYSYLLFELVKRDFVLKYRRSFLGIIWSVLNPLLMMVILSIVFSQIFRVQIENYAVYYLTGSLIFSFMTDSTTNSLTSIVSNAGLIKKVYIPKYIFPLEKCLFSLLNSFFVLIATLIIMPILGVNLQATAILVILPFVYVLIFSFGLGLILSTINVFFSDIAHLYGILTTAWMYLTPILYPIDILPKNIQKFSIYNPMFHFVNFTRDVLIYNNIPNFKQNFTCIAISFVIFCIGILVFKSKQNKFVLYI